MIVSMSALPNGLTSREGGSEVDRTNPTVASML
jgi:hypothetical protein